MNAPSHASGGWEHLAVVREHGIKYLISPDRDFEVQEEYRTPKEFVELMWGKEKESDI